MNHPMIAVLADGPATTGPDFGKASPVGLLVVVLLLIAVFALMWSMNRHLNKAREHFEAIGEPPAAGSAGNSPPREPTGESGG